MTTKHPFKKTNLTLTALASLLLLVAMSLQIGRAEGTEDDMKKTALAAMTQWLGEIDRKQYTESWKTAAKSFQQSVTEQQWADALDHVRKPLGKCLERKLASEMYQTEIPVTPDKTLKGDFMIAQFDTSFENLKYAIETVTFEKESDGVWRASGYYIKPR